MYGTTDIFDITNYNKQETLADSMMPIITNSRLQYVNTELYISYLISLKYLSMCQQQLKTNKGQ